MLLNLFKSFQKKKTILIHVIYLFIHFKQTHSQHKNRRAKDKRIEKAQIDQQYR